jgi:2'-5' RNA ligase
MPDRSARSLTKNITEGVGTTTRVFFAVWPDNAAQAQMTGLKKRLDLASLCNGRETKAENIHLTLAFVGDVEPNRLAVLQRVGDAVEGSGIRAFDFAIDEIRYWKHNHIVYAAPTSIPPELPGLVNALSDGLSAAGFSLERRTYAPHITLMRNASCQVLPKLPEPVVWRVRQWMLIKSELASDGSVYSPIGRWRLA